MTTQERQLIQSALELLHRAIGLDDAAKAFKPLLRFADERTFPGRSDTNATISTGEEKTPPAQPQGANFLQEEADVGETSGEKGILFFNQKEINSMPKKFKKLFNVEGHWVTIRKRVRGKTSCSFEIRYRRDGYNISASGRTEERARQRFLEKLHFFESDDIAALTKIPTTFHEFATFYFENYRIRKVAKLTYKMDVQKYNNHLKPVFKSMPLKAINNEMCQAIVDKYNAREQRKTAKELSSLLSGIFNYAVNHGIIPRNPIKLVINEDYESEHGVALTKEEERLLLDSVKDTPYLVPLAVILYTGLRPCEYESAKISGKFIVAINAKQKNGKVSYKRIAISPMLEPYLENVSEIVMPHKRTLNRRLKAVLPNHKLYDLRTTFNTRCEEFHVVEIARKMFMGHNLEKLQKAYTDLPDEWFLAEIQKIRY